jgi:hypothetical protein
VANRKPILLVGLGLFLSATVLAAGCRNVPERVGKSPLKPPRMSPDTVIVDVFFIRFPFGESEPNGPLWAEIDETPWPPTLRQKLAMNGFRVGLVAGQVPPIPLSKLLELKDKPVATGPEQETGVTDLGEEPRVTQRHMPLHCGQRGEVFTSGPYEELAVLVCNHAGVEGETFQDARPVLGACASLEPDGRVRLKLVPELKYGPAKPTLVGQPGIMRLESNQAKRVFQEMTIETSLRPGQMVVLGSLPERRGSLGHHFFTQKTNGRMEQKLLVIRLSQTQHDGLFDAPGVLPMEVLTEEKEIRRNK